MMKQRGPARAGNRERLGRGSPAGVLESLDTASSPALRALAAVRYSGGRRVVDVRQTVPTPDVTTFLASAPAIARHALSIEPRSHLGQRPSMPD